MKRSDMINLIQRYLMVYFDIRDINKEGCDSLLRMIEEKGMLPPIHYPYGCSCSTRGMCPKCTPGEYKRYNVWEPEDENT